METDPWNINHLWKVANTNLRGKLIHHQLFILSIHLWKATVSTPAYLKYFYLNDWNTAPPGTCITETLSISWSCYLARLVLRPSPTRPQGPCRHAGTALQNQSNVELLHALYTDWKPGDLYFCFYLLKQGRANLRE